MLFNRLIALFVGLIAASASIGQTVSLRVATFNIENYDGSSPQFEAARDILIRVDADVVFLQEIGSFSALQSLGTATGYSNIFLADPNGDIDLGTDFSGVLSRFPLVGATSTRTAATISGDPTALDIVRNFAFAEVAVPGAAENFLVAINHWKAGTGDDNEFRRSIESIRSMQLFTAVDSAAIPYMIVGDMNDDISDSPDSPSQFSSEPAGLPISFNLGNDIFFPVANSVFLPFQTGTGADSISVVSAFQLVSQSGEPSDSTRPASGRRLDYLWRSDAVTIVGTEVYDSRDEGAGGLPKAGAVLPSTTSATASDHLVVFADIEIASSGPPTGACCEPGGTCLEAVIDTDCATAGGHFYGNGSACGGILDPICEAPGACCFGDGNCQDSTESFDCLNGSGLFYGPATTCAGPIDPVCEAPGACCVGNGVCRDDLDSLGCDSLGGLFYGAGVSCLGVLDPPCEAVIAEGVIINEVMAKADAGEDTEFIELFGTPLGSLENMSLLVIEGQTASKGIVDRIYDLSGQSLDADGYFLLGDTALSPDMALSGGADFENGSETFVLVENLLGSILVNTDLDTNNDGSAEVPVGTVIDAVGLVGGSGFPDYAIYFGGSEIGPQVGLFPDGAARIPNGIDTNNAADWVFLSGALDGSEGDQPITPDAANSGDGDFDADGDRDLADYGSFQNCFTGPGISPIPPCEPGDLDGDNDDDLDDLVHLVANMAGP